MKIRRVMLIIISVIIMITTFNIGIMGDRVSIEEQFFNKQVIRIEDNSLYNTEGTGIFNLATPNILLTTIVLLAIALILCIIIANKNGLFFISERKQKEQNIRQNKKEDKKQISTQIRKQSIKQKITITTTQKITL